MSSIDAALTTLREALEGCHICRSCAYWRARSRPSDPAYGWCALPDVDEEGPFGAAEPLPGPVRACDLYRAQDPPGYPK